MIKEIIKDKLRDKQWTFSEITNITQTVNELAEYAFDTMTAKEKLDLIWNDKLVSGPLPEEFGQLFGIQVANKLAAEIAIIIKEELSDATVMFKENENEISKRSVGGEPHKERPTDEATDSEE
jgi:hypothetical protein